jgi:hypothetical protein
MGDTITDAAAGVIKLTLRPCAWLAPAGVHHLSMHHLMFASMRDCHVT